LSPTSTGRWAHSVFQNNPYLSVGHSYQVRRAEFDRLLLDNSRRLGAEVREEVRVTDVALDKGQGPRITAVDKKGSKAGWLPRFLVDATGARHPAFGAART
jgi:halogenation protein CepH